MVKASPWNRAPKRQAWVRMPNRWIEDGLLQVFSWRLGQGSDHLAGLMTYTAIVQNADQETGQAQLTYDELCAYTHLSRPKLSRGLSVAADYHLIERGGGGRSSFALTNFDPKMNWAQLPSAGLYRNGGIAAFAHFNLRLQAELDALKLYLLFASRRDRNVNHAKLTYPNIESYSGVNHNNIRRALSLLASLNLIHIDLVPSKVSLEGAANAYRLTHLNTRHHMGTIGRSTNDETFADLTSLAVD